MGRRKINRVGRTGERVASGRQRRGGYSQRKEKKFAHEKKVG